MEREVVAREYPTTLSTAVETVSDKDHLHLPLPAARALILYETGQESMNFVTQFFVSYHCRPNSTYSIFRNALRYDFTWPIIVTIY